MIIKAHFGGYSTAVTYQVGDDFPDMVNAAREAAWEAQQKLGGFTDATVQFWTEVDGERVLIPVSPRGAAMPAREWTFGARPTYR